MNKSTHESVVAALIEVAKQGKTITYGDLGKKLGFNGRKRWSDVLDTIARTERMAGRPDLTRILVNLRSGYPTFINGEYVDKPTWEEMQVVDKQQKEVWSYYKKKDNDPNSIRLRDFRLAMEILNYFQKEMVKGETFTITKASDNVWKITFDFKGNFKVHSEGTSVLEAWEDKR